MSLARTSLTRRGAVVAVSLALLATACGGSSRREGAAVADADPAAAATSITVGASFPFSGPFAIFSNASKGAAAYFESVNAEGGVDGKKITYKVNDDAYDPARLAANARKSVEQDKAAAFLSFGGPNVTVQPYLNQNKVPQIVLAGNAEFSRTEQFPYTHAYWPDLGWEAQYVTQYVLDHPDAFPAPKIGLISLNNSLSTSHVAGTVAALGDRADAVFPEANRLQVEPRLADYTSQLNQLKAAGVNVLYLSPGVAGLISALRYIEQTGWDTKIVLYSASASIKGTLVPAGAPAATGVYAPAWLKDPADPRWADDAGLKTYRDVIAKYGQGADPDQSITANGYGAAEALVAALRGVGDGGLTGEAVNEAWLAVQDQDSDVLVPGASLDAGPGGRLVHDYQLMEFDGKQYRDVGELADTVELGIAK